MEVALEERLLLERAVLRITPLHHHHLEPTLHNHQRDGHSDVTVARDLVPHDVALADGGHVQVVVVHERDVHAAVAHQLRAPLLRLR